MNDTRNQLPKAAPAPAPAPASACEAVLASGYPVPATTADAIVWIDRLHRYADASSTLSYWHIGAAIRRMRDLDIKHPADVAAARANLSPRMMRYCEAVYQAFDDYPALERWTRGGLTWTAIRELSSPRLDGYRPHILEMFEAGHLTPVEVEHQAIAQRKARATRRREHVATDQGAEADLGCITGKVRATATQLQKDIDVATCALQAGLVTTLANEDGSLRRPAEDRIVAMSAALQATIVDACELLYKASTLVFIHDFPFWEIETRIASLRQDFEAE